MTGQPAVLPFAPARGWQQASDVQRGLVLLFPLLLVFWAVLPHLTDHETRPVNDLSAVLGGLVFYAVARVLRPHPSFSAERLLRHGFASLSVSCATNFFFVVAFAGDAPEPSSWLPISIASLGLVITLPWGLVSCVVRSTRVDNRVTLPDYDQRVLAGRQPRT